MSRGRTGIGRRVSDILAKAQAWAEANPTPPPKPVRPPPSREKLLAKAAVLTSRALLLEVAGKKIRADDLRREAAELELRAKNVKSDQ